jgi:uncharacterized transporter YbjL
MQRFDRQAHEFNVSEVHRNLPPSALYEHAILVGKDAGACVTVLPLVLVAIVGRVVCKLNFIDLSGLIAGSMTDPPALAFASSVARSDAPTVAYATVYPLTTLLRILSAQVLAIVLFR